MNFQSKSLSAQKIPVDSTTHISFDEDTRTFRILCGQSVYCFCISVESDLQHLYWGRYVDDFDIRFQFQKIRKNHYTTHSVFTSASYHQSNSPQERQKKKIFDEKMFDVFLSTVSESQSQSQPIFISDISAQCTSP